MKNKAITMHLSVRTLYFVIILVCCLATASCNQATDVKSRNSTETKQLTPVAVPSQTTPSERRWEEAYNKGVELINQAKPTEASYYFSNALGASPGNAIVIEAYCRTMFDLSKLEGGSASGIYDLSVLQILEGFLQGQIPLVPFEDVEKILAILAEVREKMDILPPPTRKANPEYDRVLGTIADGTFVVPETGEKLIAALETLDELKEYESERNNSRGGESEASKEIDALTTQVQSALEYLTLVAMLEDRKNAVSEACKASATIAEYRLQECEQCLRQMIALPPSPFSGRLTEDWAELKSLADSVIEAKGNENWREILPKLNAFKEKRGQIKSAHNGFGVFQQKLENLQQEASLLQNTLVTLSGTSLEEGVSRLESLKEENIKLSNAQSQAYNTWAMGKIKACLQKGREGVGFFANGAEGRKTIGKALIDELGPIDRRYLTTEVSRCFDEVMGKYLAPNQLNPVKKETDLNEEGTILYTLNRMHETSKKQVSAF